MGTGRPTFLARLFSRRNRSSARSSRQHNHRRARSSRQHNHRRARSIYVQRDGPCTWRTSHSAFCSSKDRSSRQHNHKWARSSRPHNRSWLRNRMRARSSSYGHAIWRTDHSAFSCHSNRQHSHSWARSNRRHNRMQVRSSRPNNHSLARGRNRRACRRTHLRSTRRSARLRRLSQASTEEGDFSSGGSLLRGGNTVAAYSNDCRLARTWFFGVVPVR